MLRQGAQRQLLVLRSLRGLCPLGSVRCGSPRHRCTPEWRCTPSCVRTCTTSLRCWGLRQGKGTLLMGAGGWKAGRGELASTRHSGGRCITAPYSTARGGSSTLHSMPPLGSDRRAAVHMVSYTKCKAARWQGWQLPCGGCSSSAGCRWALCISSRPSRARRSTCANELNVTEAGLDAALAINSFAPHHPYSLALP